MRRRVTLTLSLVGAALIAAALLRLVVGGDSPAWPASEELWRLRGARVLAGTVVGACLGGAGVMLQCLLRNPLASPDLLGLASGSGFGVMFASYLAFKAGQGIAPGAASAPAALIGSLGALGIVYALSQRRGILEPVTLILIGVVVSIIASAATMFVQHMLPDRGVAAGRWLLGALNDDTTGGQLAAVGGVALAVVLGAAWMGPAMDAASLSDDEARAVGVPLDRLRAFLFIGAGVLSAGSVILAGPIGFVGLICPHVVRLGAGPGHRVLVLGAAGAGAALVVGADAAVKAVDLSSGRLPIGVITSIIGGPLFVVMLRREFARRGA